MYSKKTFSSNLFVHLFIDCTVYIITLYVLSKDHIGVESNDYKQLINILNLRLNYSYII